MRASGAPDARVSWDESSTCACIERTADAVDQTAKPEIHNREISHAWISCMRVSPHSAPLSDGKRDFQLQIINRISLPFPNL